MNSDGWMKAIMHSKTVCGANNLNPQVLFYGGHGRYFDNRAIHILHYNHIKYFALKACESGNDQPNENGPNIKLDRFYGKSRMD